MNILSKLEMKAFEDAFNCIMRLSNASTRDATEIRVGGESIPSTYYNLISDVGGLDMLEHHFCPMHKNETIKWLIKRCYKEMQQPSDFIYQGAVSVEKHNYNVVEHTFN